MITFVSWSMEPYITLIFAYKRHAINYHLWEIFAPGRMRQRTRARVTSITYLFKIQTAKDGRSIILMMTNIVNTRRIDMSIFKCIVLIHCRDNTDFILRPDSTVSEMRRFSHVFCLNSKDFSSEFR